MINFPSNPSLNQFYSAGGKTWKWIGNRWIIANANTTIDFGLTTANVPESGNLYFTNARARAAFTSGNNITIAANGLITSNSSGGGSFIGSTDDVPEGANLYYTNARVYSNVIGLLNIKANIADLNTSNISEGTNLYFTNTRAIQAFTSGSGITVASNGLITANPVIEANAGVVIAYTQSFISSNANSYSLTTYVNDPKDLFVSVNGLLQIPTIDYLASGNTITFTAIQLPQNSYIEIRFFGTSGVIKNSNVITDSLVEGNINLFFSNSRARSAFIAGQNITIEANGMVTSIGGVSGNTNALSEGSLNLYYSNERVYANVINLINAKANITDLTTSNITENTNLYFTNARVYANVIGLINAKANLTDLTTSNIVEGTGLYFTNARVYANVINLINAKANVTDLNTSNIIEGNNLYFTNDRVYSNIIQLNYATTSYVTNSIANIIDSAPAVLDTLKELANALGNDSSFSTTVTNQLALKANSTDLTTANVIELNNLYYTNARVYANVIGLINVKANTTDLTTSNVAEGANLYFTNARVLSAVHFDSFTGNIIPESNNLQYLGNATNRWHSVFVGPGSIDIEGIKLSKDNGQLSIISPSGNVIITPNVANFLSNVSATGGSTSSITVSATAPSNPSVGNQWFNSNTGDLGVYYSNAWVSVGGGGGGSSIASTTDLAEGANLYFTNARVASYINQFVYSSNIRENGDTTSGNVYFSNSRARAAFTAGNGITIAANGMIIAAVSSAAVTPANISDQVNISTGYLAVPSGNTAQRPVSPANGFMRYNTTTGYGEIYNSSVGQWLQFGAAPTFNIEYLVVAGGGGGGRNYYTASGTRPSGGGGAGGFRSGTLTEISVNTNYTITVGAGGSGASTDTSAGVVGQSGSNSVFNTITSAGGGGGTGHSSFNNGGTYPFAYPPNSGGSGGADIHGGTGAAGNTPATVPSQGNNGGAGVVSGSIFSGGGGGGASSVGSNGTGSVGGNGGAGTYSSISGSNVAYSGGGGGSITSGTGGSGGVGGGGSGSSGNGAGTSGTTNTGGGGGGGISATAGSGGSGVVILKYLSSYTATFSVGLTASTVTSSGYKISTITAGTGTVTFTIA